LGQGGYLMAFKELRQAAGHMGGKLLQTWHGTYRGYYKTIWECV